MELVALYFAFCIVVGILASHRNRDFIRWFFLAAIISPLFAIFGLYAIPAATEDDDEPTRRCPHCDESIRLAATVCRFCQRSVPPTAQ